MNIKNIIHVGGHFGQEVKTYKEINPECIVDLFEAHPVTFEHLKQYMSHFKKVNCHNIALGATDGELEMYVETANQGQSNSFLKPKLHLEQYPHIQFPESIKLKVTKLDKFILPKDYNFLSIDVQGYELEVLKGAKKTLQHIDYIMTEVNNSEVYENCCIVTELDIFLSDFGFERVETNWQGGTWGDALYIKKIKFSLCIPTYERYDLFLKKYLPGYIDNEYIDEIIITDDNGSDIDKIKKDFNSTKLKLFKNDRQLGSMFNKLNSCSKAKNSWIALIDSDNYADIDYFKIVEKYIENNSLKNYTILAPSFAKPNFDYRDFQNTIVTRKNIGILRQKYEHFYTFLNTCNYVISKKVVTQFLKKNSKLLDSTERLYKSPSDSMLLLVLFFQTMNLKIHIVENLHYNHVVHDGSYYLQMHQEYMNEIHHTHELLYKL